MVSQISGQTTHLVIGVDPGPKKLSDADKYGIAKVSFSELIALLDVIKRPASTGSDTHQLDMLLPPVGKDVQAATGTISDAIVSVLAAADPTAANQLKHFEFFAKRKWTVVEAGGGGNCFFHSVLLVNRIHQYSTILPKTHAALRNQVVLHMRENIDTLVVCDQPIEALLLARSTNFLSNMKREGVYVEYEIIGGFAHMIKQAVIVYSLHCGTPLVISASWFYMFDLKLVASGNFS